MSKPDKIPELLAPAGTIDAALAAFDAGADAVYAGLPRFNARERGRNFSPGDLFRLIEYSRKINRKVYVTLNTLLKDRELPEVIDILAELALVRPHALIVQDLGLVRIVREHFDRLPLHASTQMGVHNSAGARIARSLGLKRVILERQVTLAEVETIKRETLIELEIFVHGALCCSRSGACLLSSWMGGWSGNRGRCKQPCRRRYHAPGGNGFFFSTRDICSINEIPRIRGMGLSSLKIEGRLKGADYVGRVVSAYRKVLDAPSEQVSGAIAEANRMLAAAQGRRPARAFVSLSDFEGVIRHDSLGASGRPCGEVVKWEKGALFVKLSRTLGRGDTVRVQPRSGDEGPALTVTHLSVAGRNVERAHAGDTCRIICDTSVPARSLLFHTGSTPPDRASRIDGLAEARPVLDIAVSVTSTAVTVQSICTGHEWTAPLATQPARQHALDPPELATEFGKSASASLSAGHVEADVAPDLFVRASDLKQERRDFWVWAASTITPEQLEAYWEQKKKNAIADLAAPVRRAAGPAEKVVALSTPADTPADGGMAACPLRLDCDSAHAPGAALYSPDNEIILPDFCAEGDLPELRRRIEAMIENGTRRFRLTSLYGLALFPADRELRLTSSFPLPACNRPAAVLLMERGVDKVQAWVELERTALQELAVGLGASLEIYTYGRLPLLTTRFGVPVQGDIRDGRGAGFRVETESGMTNLYSEQVMKISPPAGLSTYVDLTHCEPGVDATNAFNYDRELA